MITFYFESFFPCNCFQSIDTLKRLVCSIQILQEVGYFAACMVNKEATTWISVALFSKCVWEMTLNWREIVVRWYTITRHQLILSEDMSLQRRTGSLIIRSLCRGFSIETCCNLSFEVSHVGTQLFVGKNGPECKAWEHLSASGSQSLSRIKVWIQLIEAWDNC